MKLPQLDREGEELSAGNVKDGEEPYSSPDHRDAVEIAARVVALLDTRSSSIAVDSLGAEADNYDGSISVSEWLRRKSQ